MPYGLFDYVPGSDIHTMGAPAPATTYFRSNATGQLMTREQVLAKEGIAERVPAAQAAAMSAKLKSLPSQYTYLPDFDPSGGKPPASQWGSSQMSSGGGGGGGSSGIVTRAIPENPPQWGDARPVMGSGGGGGGGGAVFNLTTPSQKAGGSRPPGGGGGGGGGAAISLPA